MHINPLHSLQINFLSPFPYKWPKSLVRTQTATLLSAPLLDSIISVMDPTIPHAPVMSLTQPPFSGYLITSLAQSLCRNRSLHHQHCERSVRHQHRFRLLVSTQKDDEIGVKLQIDLSPGCHETLAPGSIEQKLAFAPGSGCHGR